MGLRGKTCFIFRREKQNNAEKILKLKLPDDVVEIDGGPFRADNKRLPD